MNSRLYTGTVAHSRSAPSRNSFSYRLYMCYVDLAELDDLGSGLRRFGHNRRALVSFFDEDHGPRDGSPLRPWIDGVLASAGVDLEGGRVCVLAIPRVLGTRFYPASFWYCFHADGTCRAVLAEVQNTYRDHHNYLLHNGGERLDWASRPVKAKAFYVSPFLRVDDVEHVFTLTEPGETLSVAVGDRIDGRMPFGAHLSLEARELTDTNLSRVVLSMGPMSARALVLIHWQALRLFAKRVPYFAHTPPPREETSL